ncbi:zinc finger protein 37-like [Calliphora vicina]|uniref:zinc finger protein 37-like n=1 Tax=Calliphora vicina TaxID=7373 RepID=UPI00325AF7A8
MLISNPDLINSCRVCRSPNQDGDYECLYQTPTAHEERPMLSEAGILYENLFDISVNIGEYYPQFLCNSCDLQMKLFKKLKDKAYKTLKYLQNLYEEQISNAKEDDEQEELQTEAAYEQEALQNCEDNETDVLETLEEYDSLENRYQESEASEYQQNATSEYQEKLANEYQEETAEVYHESQTNEYQESLKTELVNEYLEETAEVYHESQTNEYQESLKTEYPANASDEYLEMKLTTLNSLRDEQIQQESLYTQGNSHTEEQIQQETLYTQEDPNHTIATAVGDSQESAINIVSRRNQFKVEINPTITDLKYRFSTEENTENSNENIPQIRLDLEPVIDKSDYVTEIYELLEDENKVENYMEHNENVVEYDIYTEENTHSSSTEYSDIEYVIEEEMCDMQDEENKVEVKKSNPVKRRRPNNVSKRRKIGGATKRREYKCEPCQLEFENLQEQKLHRTEVHDEKYPCSVCPKELKSLPALHQHMKLHNEQPAFQCEICQKTFNQKAHYQYHMNVHNNVRNFKCSECEKSFITKTDLKVHMRSHNGHRPYVCNICGKDYLMMEHLKTHLLTHTDQYFQCDICNHKFSTHKTLRLHVKSIHVDEPRFKCTFCSKPFRRKHHLEYHMKLHQKNVTFLDSRYEMIDDPDACVISETGYNSDDIVDQELVDDPGFIAL